MAPVRLRQAALAATGAAVYYGSDPLGDAAQQFSQMINAQRAANWQQYWSLCKVNNCVMPVNGWSTGGCGLGNIGCAGQAINTHPYGDQVPAATNAIYVGDCYLFFGSERIRIVEVYSRIKAGIAPAADPANPTVPLTIPEPLLNPWEVPAPWPAPQVYPPRPQPQTRPAPRPRPDEQPSRPQEAPWGPAKPQPIDIPPQWGPVVQPGLNMPPEAVPRSWGYDFNPDGSVTSEPMETPRTPRKPPKRTKERKQNVRSVGGAAWVAANAAFGAVEFVQNANKTLPKGVRLPGNASPQAMAANVYANFDQVDWEVALEVTVNDEIEDQFFGRTFGRGGAAANRMSGASTGGGSAMSAGGRQARYAAHKAGNDHAYDLPTVDIDPATGRVRVVWP